MTTLNGLLVDPSLFTAPYDGALSEGLEANGVKPVWLTRRLRPNESEEIPALNVRPIFYGLTDGPRRRHGKRWQVVKGLEHIAGLRRTAKLARRGFDVVHFQWTVLPRIDIHAIKQMRRHVPVVLTVHDTTPFNGKAVNPMQVNGLDDVLHAVDALIVHTEFGRETLCAQGIDADRINVIPHGPLRLRESGAEERRPERWRIVMFGRLQAYKGLDVLIEAAGLFDAETRARIEIVIAGEPMTDLAPHMRRVMALGLQDVFEFRPHRLDDAAMAALLHSADAFVFPYRAIEASGVLYLVAELGKWMVASDLGAFRDMISDGDNGALVEPGDAARLADALRGSIDREVATGLKSTAGWTEIGGMTRQIYERLIRDRRELAA
jgi:glycosyltransferase involved in cell wall biosynthesis